VSSLEDDLWFVRSRPRVVTDLARVPRDAFVAPLCEESRVSFTNRADAERYQTRVDQAIRSHRLGHSVIDGSHLRCLTADFQWAQLARELITAVLVREGAPRDVTVDEEIRGIWYRHHVYLPSRLQAAPAGWDFGLDFLGRTRAKPKVGDVFVYRLGDGRYQFGRVMRDGIDIGLGDSRAMLLYFYRVTSESPDNVPVLDKHELAVPPVLHDHFLWRQGAFRTVANIGPTDGDELAQHCFEALFAGQVSYLNEHGERIERSEPCGHWGYMNYLLLDVMLCNAWGEPGRPYWTSGPEG
jgi:hypothetical protein